ncbi:Bug family tripartite tricarboxylate transporter substrate binding protein [Rhodovarius crocodyli]|nr:tripartite tricarboxylate transporter substrate binding protein [Rhodovarius crocodyli]
MTLIARRALLAASALPLAGPAFAQAYPTRPLRLIVGFGAGGISDLVARLVAEAAGQAIGQSIIVENRTGAGGTIAAEAAARATPDGYTLLFGGPSLFAINAVMMGGSVADTAKELAPVLPLASTPHVLVVRPQLGVTDLAGFVARARQRNGEMTWSTAGVGTSPHQTMVLLQSLSGARFTPVHYRSGAAGVQAVLSGEVDVTAEATAVVVEHIRAGTLVGLVAAAPERLDLLPNVPSSKEAGMAELENGSLSALLVPRATPQPVRDKLREAFGTALASATLRQRLAQQGTFALGGDAAALEGMIATEVAKWRPLLAGLAG